MKKILFDDKGNIKNDSGEEIERYLEENPHEIKSLEDIFQGLISFGRRKFRPKNMLFALIKNEKWDLLNIIRKYIDFNKIIRKSHMILLSSLMEKGPYTGNINHDIAKNMLDNLELDPFVKDNREWDHGYNIFQLLLLLPTETNQRFFKHILEPYIIRNNLTIQDDDLLLNNVYKNVDQIDVPDNILVTVFQIANLHRNVNVVNLLRDRFVNIRAETEVLIDKNFIEINFNEIRDVEARSQNNQYYPLLWKYDIVQIRDYVEGLINIASDDILTLEQVTYTEDIEIFTENETKRFGKYLYDEKIWLKKPRVSRYFGAKHLRDNGFDVPEKKILRLDKKPIQVRVTFAPIFCGLKNINPITINFMNCEVLSEFIEGADKLKYKDANPFAGNSGVTDNEQATIRESEEFGYRDLACGNFLRKNDTLYFIDTELEKNFFTNDLWDLYNDLKALYETTFFDIHTNNTHDFYFCIDN